MSIVDYANEYFRGIQAAIREVDQASLEAITDVLRDAWRQDRRIFILGNGGGYILAAGHTVPDDVSAENVIAMLEAARDLEIPPG